ncbi:unnamed protein product [Rhodiola kirilowii]
MGLQDDDVQSLDQPADENQEVPKKTKITYATTFLLSLSDLELCKQLPDGFDKSILNQNIESLLISTSKFHDALHGSQEKARASGGFATQNLGQTEYSASPTTRRDASSYSRGSAGKWESRSRDSDYQSDRDSESGRQFGTHSRRPWQNSEHDGLLGSGASSKLIAHTSGTSAPKFRASEEYHLNRSNAPYQPPRPYKAVPHNRSTTNDLRNDETFGYAEITSADQAEEERKRRAEFELMRKERYKSSQDKQYLSPVDGKDDSVSDAMESRGNLNEEKRILGEGNESHEPSIVLTPHNASTKSSAFLQTPAPRPVVPRGFIPPGFSNTSVVPRSAIRHDSKVQISEIDNHLVYDTLNSSMERKSDDKTVKQPDDQSHLHISHHAGTSDLLVNGEGFDSNRRALQHTADVSNQDFATPILEDIFGNSLTMNGGGLSISTEHPDGNIHDKWKGSIVESSKFANWFVEDHGKKTDDVRLSEKPISLLSLIGGGPINELSHVDAKAAKTIGASVPALTCVDLEHSILSEMNHHKVPSETPFQGSESHDVNVAQPEPGIDAPASQHLLSVLQKKPGPKDKGPSLKTGKGSSDRRHLLESTSMDIMTDSLKQRKADKTSALGKNPTLEAIFGSAFVKELQAVDAPVSTKRDSFISDSSRSRLAENDISITGCDPLNPSYSVYECVDVAKDPGYAQSNLPVGNPDRVGALSAMFRDGRSARHSQDNQVFPQNPYDMMEHNSSYHNIHAHSSPPQFPSQHMSQGQPMLNRLDAQHPAHHHMRFPDTMIGRDPLAIHQFSLGHQVFNQPRPVGYDPPSQQPMMQKQVHMQGSVPPAHLLRQYSGNLPRPPYPYSQVHGFGQELDPMQGFHISRQQPGYGGIGSSPTVVDVGSGSLHPEAIRRLMEIELRLNQKRNHPFTSQLGGLPNF